MLNLLGIRNKKSDAKKLNAAIVSNDIKQLQSLLDQGASPNSYYKDGLFPLETAVRRKNITATTILLNKGADPDFPYLRRSLLNEAIVGNNLELFRLLLDHGADIERGEPRRPNTISNIDGKTPLHMAIEFGNMDVVNELLARKVNVNDIFYISPLMAAIKYGRVEIAKKLIQNGADIYYTRSNGLTTYKMSIEEHQPEITKMIIKKDTENKIGYLKSRNTYFSVIPGDLLGLIINS